MLIKSLLDNNIPKYVPNDLPIFKAIIQDLFPGYQIENVQNQVLQLTIA